MADTTRERLAEALARNPTWPVKTLAQSLGVSRARVYQILSDMSVKPPVSIPNRRYGKRGTWGPSIPRVVTSGVVSLVGSSIAGTIGELLVAADLMARGLFVFFPLVRTAVYDLIACTADGSTTIRIEVRCGTRNTMGSLSFSKTPTRAGSHDHYAIVVAGEPVVYQPPLTLP